MNMQNHCFTIQIQTNHLKEDLSPEEYHQVAKRLLADFELLVEQQGLAPYITYRASWMKGCLIENIIIYFNELDSSAKILTATGAYIVVKDYSDICASVTTLAGQIRKIAFVASDFSVKVVRVVVRNGESPELKNKIDPSFDEEIDPSFDEENSDDQV